MKSNSAKVSFCVEKSSSIVDGAGTRPLALVLNKMNATSFKYSKKKINLLLIGLLFLFGKSSSAQILISKENVSRKRFDKYEVRMPDRDTVIFYLSATGQNERLPLLVFIQGSGRFSLFGKDTLLNYGARTLTNIVGGKARLLLVEKPGIGFLQGDQKRHDITGNKWFNKLFSLPSWSKNIERAITYVVKNRLCDTGKIMVTGHSEGGLVAAKVAHDLGSLVTHVTILAGEGPSQLYSLYAFARSGDYFQNDHRDKTEAERIDSLETIWKDICTHPLATDKYFFGYTYLRWSTFLNSSVLEELANYNGKVFIAQGTADKNVAPESAVYLYTGLLAKGRQVRLALIAGADHSFYSADDHDGWSKILTESLEQFIN